VSRPLLVTGGTGYLGSELLRRAEGQPLVGTHLGSSRRAEGGVGWLRLDVRDAAAVRAACERFRPAAVIHTAYRQEGEGSWATNVDGSRQWRRPPRRWRPASCTSPARNQADRPSSATAGRAVAR
jgi:nucleoside-diphosphate-sugar epimerase